MSYFPLLSNPVRPVLDAFYFGCTLSCRGNLAYAEKHPKTSSTKTVIIVDLEGFELSSKQLLLRHAKILVVNVLEISQNIRFKAIFSLFDAFSILSWVAIPLKHIKRLESLKISLEKYIASPLIRRFWVKYTAFLKPLYSAFWIFTRWLNGSV